MAQARALADRVIPGEGLAADLIRIAAANLLLILCARVVMPLPWTPVPITGQTFGVMLVAVLLGARRSAVALGLYLLEGAAGLPVFQPLGPPGALRFLSPTSGYLLAYPLAAYLTGWLAESPRFLPGSRVARLAAGVTAGQALILLAGCAWLALAFEMGWRGAFAAGVAPFLPGDAVKTILVVAVARSLHALPDRGA